jgi:hypothetical protein
VHPYAQAYAAWVHRENAYQANGMQVIGA